MTSIPDVPTPASFADLPLNDSILKAVEAAGFSSPTTIQEAAIPVILSGKDVVGLAHTGSGKTAAFVLPMLQKLTGANQVEALVLTPTRELAQQVAMEVDRLGKFESSLKSPKGQSRQGITAAIVVGGQPYRPQLFELNSTAQIAVATPGRILDHLSSGQLKRFAPKLIVLDEADEMLDRGFIDDIRKIFELLAGEQQVLMFSATMPEAIKRLIADLMNEPVYIRGKRQAEDKPDIKEFLVGVKPKERLPSLLRLIDFHKPHKAIVFCRTRLETDEVCKYLRTHKVPAASLHGDLGQSARTDIVSGFRANRFSLLVATDVASRGLDFSDVSHVFNFQIPENLERYTHRIGRTGRAGRSGQALTLTSPSELRDHRFFRQVSPANFELATVPSRQAVTKKRLSSLMESIFAQDISAEATDVAAQFGMANGDNDINVRLLSYVLDLQRVIGPENLGLTKEDLSQMFKRYRARPKSSPRRRDQQRRGLRGRLRGRR